MPLDAVNILLVEDNPGDATGSSAKYSKRVVSVGRICSSPLILRRRWRMWRRSFVVILSPSDGEGDILAADNLHAGCHVVKPLTCEDIHR